MNKVGNIIHYLQLYLDFAKVRFLTQLEYRGQYIIRMVTKTIGWITGFLMILILLSRFDTIGTWSKYEVLFLYSLDVLSYSIAGTFFMGSFGNLSRTIRNGELDEILTKPVNPLFYYISIKVSAGYTNNYVISIGILVFSLYKLNISLNLADIILLVNTIIGGTLIQAAAFMITAIPAFWIVNSKSIKNLFFNNFTRFIQYPITIYPRGIQLLLTFVLPYAFINYYPGIYFLKKPMANGFPSIFQHLTLFVGILMFTLAYRLWLIGLKAYQGVGS